MHRRDLVMDDRAFDLVNAVLDDGFCLCGMITDAEGRPLDYRFLRVNHLFESMTGLRDAEGRTALELVPGLERRWIETYGRVALGRERLRFVDHSVVMGRVFEVNAAPVDPPGCFVLVFRDITALHQAQTEREAALRTAESMLAELNHRIMNSFASIAAIASMEARNAPPELRETLDRLGGRVQALGALYRRLEGAARADTVDMGAHLEGVAEALRATLPSGVAVACRAEALTLPARTALPLALVANEALSDAARRAGPGPATLRLEFGVRGGALRLLLADDARPPVEPPAGSRRDVGRTLIRAFAAELGAALTDEAGERGRRVELVIGRPWERP